MLSAMEKRLKIVYPSGLLRQPDTSTFLDYKEVFPTLLSVIESNTKMRCEIDFVGFSGVAFSAAATRKVDPEFSSWVFFGRENQVKWYSLNDNYYFVMHIKFSKIWPAYEYYYNIWMPRKGWRYSDVESAYESCDEEWKDFHDIAFPLLRKLGVEIIPDEELGQVVPFIYNQGWPNEVMDDENDDDFEKIELELIPATLWQCLFHND